MPIYEFKCVACGKQFEEIVPTDTDSVPCPECKSSKTQKQMSTFAGIIKSGSPTLPCRASGASCAHSCGSNGRCPSMG